MKLLYVHHAERDQKLSVSRQEQDITKDGIAEAELFSKKLKYFQIRAIYTSPYKRCVHTSEILNYDHTIPIIKDNRLNEYDPSTESFKEFLERNTVCIDEITHKYSADSDIIICVTSGVNLTAFMCYFNNKEISNNTPRCQAVALSPILFTTDGKVL